MQHGAAASCPIVVQGDSKQVSFGGLEKVLAEPDTQLRLFGKPEVHGKRRMAVILARGASIEEARDKAKKAAQVLKVSI